MGLTLPPRQRTFIAYSIPVGFGCRGPARNRFSVEDAPSCGSAVMAVTASRFQISKVNCVEAVLRNLHHRSAPPANCSPLYLAPFAGGVSTSRFSSGAVASSFTNRVLPDSLKTLVNLARSPKTRNKLDYIPVAYPGVNFCGAPRQIL